MITLKPMTEPEFEIFLTKAVQEYALDKIKAGNWSQEEALEYSRKEFAKYLPQGVQTPGAYIFSLVNEEGQIVGYLWYSEASWEPRAAFIYDFEIYESFRRRGYARQALEMLEQDAKGRGFKRIMLHVFGHNTAARALYLKTGFVETNIQMAKKISE